MTDIRGWAARGAKQPLEPYTYDAGPLGLEEVEIAVEYCGLCHTDLSIINNEWGLSQYPVIPGHEAVGRIVAVGEHVKGLRIGQRVGVGYNADSCMHCHECMTSNNNLCPEVVPTIVGHQGGFADRIRSHWVWTIPLPDALDISSAGPLLCAGTTVFSPLVTYSVKPTDRVGIVGIGGLGHLGLKFANAWGCEVTAFTSNESKAEEAKGFGAHHVVSSRDSNEILKAANSLDFLLITVNTPLDWTALLKTLKPNGRMVLVGAVLEPMPVPAMDLILRQKSVSGSLNGAPATMFAMLDFAARHKITPQVEHFPMSKVNDALEHLANGKARYRVVLDPDFA
jgi:alcohol/geraniol dehydrogenase (NADP+)